MRFSNHAYIMCPLILISNMLDNFNLKKLEPRAASFGMQSSFRPMVVNPCLLAESIELIDVDDHWLSGVYDIEFKAKPYSVFVDGIQLSPCQQKALGEEMGIYPFDWFSCFATNVSQKLLVWDGVWAIE